MFLSKAPPCTQPILPCGEVGAEGNMEGPGQIDDAEFTQLDTTGGLGIDLRCRL